MKNKNTSLLDVQQMQVLSFDQDHDANRVIIVGSSDIAEQIREGLKDIKITVEATPQVVPAAQQVQAPHEPLVIKVPYQTIIKEIEIHEIEKPIIIEKTQIVEVEKTIVVPQQEVITVEKHHIVKEQQQIPKAFMYIMMAQTFIAFLSLLASLTHK